MKYGKCPKCGPHKSTHPALRFYKTSINATVPTWGTQYAACFDLAACLTNEETVKQYDVWNEYSEVVAVLGSITIHPGTRAMIPTGLILDIPVGYSVYS